MAALTDQIRALVVQGMSNADILSEMVRRGYNSNSVETLISRARREMDMREERPGGAIYVPMVSGVFAMMELEAEERGLSVRTLCFLLLNEIGNDPDLIDAVLDDPRFKRRPSERKSLQAEDWREKFRQGFSLGKPLCPVQLELDLEGLLRRHRQTELNA